MFKKLRHILNTPKIPRPGKRAAVAAMHAVGRLLWAPAWLPRRPRMSKLGPSPRILLIRVDGIGDLVMTAALFPALRRVYPAARIDLICSTRARELAKLFVESGDLDELHVLPLGTPLKAIRRLMPTLRANRYDVAVDLRGDFRNVLMAWRTGAAQRFGMSYSGMDFLLTRKLPPAKIHQAEEVAALAAFLGITEPLGQPRLELNDDLRSFADQWLADRLDGTRPRRLVAFHLSTGMTSKLWPLDRFIAVGQHLERVHGARAIVVGGPDDVAIAETFSAALETPALIAAGQTSLLQCAALLAACDLFVGTDSGPAHMAAAVQCPVVVLFGLGDPVVMRPYSEAGMIVDSPVPCHPLCDTTCAVPQSNCLLAIHVPQVCAAIDRMLQTHPLARRPEPAAGADLA